MKKTAFTSKGKKLALKFETIRTLTTKELNLVVGGAHGADDTGGNSHATGPGGAEYPTC